MGRFLAVLSAVLCVAASACAADGTPPAFADPLVRPLRPDLSTLTRLRFLATTDFPPFSALDAQGRLSGFNVDLAREICRELGIRAVCDIQAVPWAELRSDLLAGKGDAILAGVAVTAQARQDYAFSQPYLRLPGRFVVARSDGAGEPLVRALAGGTVGAMAGSAHEKFLRERFAGLAVRSYSATAPMLADLQAGRIRAVFGDGLRLSFWLNGEDGACCRFAGGPYWAPDYFGNGLAIAVRPGDETLVQALDFALHALAVEDRFTELTLRWFPVGFF